MIDAAQYIGKVLDEQYRIKKVIGNGASSVVFYAEDLLMKLDDGSPMPVALKILDRDSGEYKLNSKSFETETRAVVGIPVNSHTVAVQDVRHDRAMDVHFIVMEYVKGKTLRRYMNEHGAFSAREIVSIALQVLSALRNAHEAGVIHRDVKPQNILVQDDVTAAEAAELPGGKGMPFVKLADFGIALLPDEDLFAMSDRGVGTVHYISPEQAGGMEVDARSDLYSLGVVMHELASGRVPFDAESASAVITQHQTAAPTHVRTYNPNIPLSLDNVIFTAMQKDPRRRFKDAAAMEKKLYNVIKELDGEAPVEETPKAPTPISVKKKPTKAPKPPKVKKEPFRIPKAAWISGIAVAAAAFLVVLGVLLFPVIKGAFDGDAMVTVPKLVGTKYDANATYADGVTVKILGYESSFEVEEGFIISQDRGAGLKVQGSVTVGIVISTGKPMMPLVIPAEHRANHIAAANYLEKEFSGKITVLRADIQEYDPEKGSAGEVIAARYADGRSEEDIPVKEGMSGEIPNTATTLILVVNGEKKIDFFLPEDKRTGYEAVKKYIDDTYGETLNVTDFGKGDIETKIAAVTVNGKRYSLDETQTFWMGTEAVEIGFVFEISFSIPSGKRASYDAAKTYVEQKYAGFITVTSSRGVAPEDYDKSNLSAYVRGAYFGTGDIEISGGKLLIDAPVEIGLTINTLQ